MLLIFAASSLQQNQFPNPKIFHYDKLIHLTEYTLFGLVASWAFLREADRRLTRRAWLVIGFGWLYGISDELHQYFVPSRQMDVFDFTADAIGVFIGVVIFIWLLRRRNLSEG